MVEGSRGVLEGTGSRCGGGLGDIFADCLLNKIRLVGPANGIVTKTTESCYGNSGDDGV